MANLLRKKNTSPTHTHTCVTFTIAAEIYPIPAVKKINIIEKKGSWDIGGLGRREDIIYRVIDSR